MGSVAHQPDEPETFPNFVRRLRAELGMTQSQVASRAQCSLAYVQRIEAGAVPRGGPTSNRVVDVLQQARLGAA